MNSLIVQTLRKSAKAMPLWKNVIDAGADELERKQELLIVQNQKLFIALTALQNIKKGEHVTQAGKDYIESALDEILEVGNE